MKKLWDEFGSWDMSDFLLEEGVIIFRIIGIIWGGGLCRNSQPWKWIEGVSNLKFGSIVGRLHIGVEGNLSPMPSSLSESISNPSVSEII